MIGYPLDSHVTFKTDGTPVFDRAISSAPYRKLIKSLFSDGVLPNPSTNLQVSAGTGMKVNLYAGFAICNGCQKLQESNTALDIATASAVNDRIDTVVLRLNDNDDVRECEFYILTGTPANTPVRPSLTQTDSIWEIGLADILVKANSTQISNANITDTRYETARCGVISSISEFDTTTLYQQIQSDLQEFREVNQANFIAWVESLKSKLAENVAANLQLQIDEINENHQLKTYLSPTLMDSTKNWTNYALKDLKAGRCLMASLSETTDISNAYTNGVIPVQKAGTLKGINVNNNGFYQYFTIDGEQYINSCSNFVADTFTGWNKFDVDTLTTLEQVTASTDVSKPVGAGAVQELNNSLAKLKTYSTTEIDTGEKWIDGKSIYRKVITGGSISEANYISLDIGVNIDTLTSASGCCTDYTGIKRDMNDSCGVSLTNWKNNKINVSSNSAAISSFTIIIEYTKII